MTVAAIRRPIGDASVLVAGIARDCGARLEQSLATLDRATAGFAKTRFLIVESDSTDDTAARLLRHADGDKFRVLPLGALCPQMPLRTQRIAHCRNLIVAEAGEARYAEVDYVVLADLDGINRTVTRAGIESAWASPEPWDAVTANQRGRYYDVWALRHPDWSPDDCWAVAGRLAPIFGRGPARKLAVHARQLRLPPDAPLMEVDSAFGGLGIYRKQAFLAGYYEGVDKKGAEVCEHVPFHAGLRAAGHRIYINPALLNAPQHEHTDGALPLPLRIAAECLRRLGLRG